ncbi:unnamed protein product [Blepharisma stoltei]|uniref:Uncharacterized protein n=1 Tax=Blepharisma stoltei TaxID=1481888 RepID=A0AAU9K8T9_9CILI|nr:unnamed protein product [Blepharisma stoltei]
MRIWIYPMKARLKMIKPRDELLSKNNILMHIKFITPIIKEQSILGSVATKYIIASFLWMKKLDEIISP